jgi:vibriolysin
MASTGLSAQRVMLHRVDATDPAQKAQFLNADAETNFRELTRTVDSATGNVHIRYQQLYNGLPLFGYHMLVTEDSAGNVIDQHGSFITNLREDLNLADEAPQMRTPEEWLKLRQSQHQMRTQDVGSWVFYNEQANEIVYLPLNGDTAVRAIYVSFMADSAQGGHPSRPVYIIDPVTGENIAAYDSLTFAEATGPGGNARTGKYFYGKDFPALEVTYNASTDMTTMANAKVATVNLNGASSGSTPYSFKGTENLVKEINGAYSPLNDAQYFGTVVFNMYKEWLNAAPLTFQLQMRVHYSRNYENAFWDGKAMTFGDGATTFYPLVALDVSAHEVSHGFTEQNSGLIYQNQSGGINESFSDMAGEAAKLYGKGSNDFLLGHDIMKKGDALRYMADPAKDGSSIGSAKDYYDGLDVHYSSGVYNKAFYKLATAPGWDTKKAFITFAKANANYWEPSTDFVTGAVGTCKAAADLGYSTKDVEAAFAAVDIIVPGCKEGPTPEVEFLNKSGSLRQGKSASFGPFTVKAGTTVTVKTGGSGDVDLYVQTGSKPTESKYLCASKEADANEQCQVTIPAGATRLYALVVAREASDYQINGTKPQ